MRFGFDFIYYLVAVFIAFVQRAQDNRVYMAADKVGAYRAFRLFFGRFAAGGIGLFAAMYFVVIHVVFLRILYYYIT